MRATPPVILVVEDDPTTRGLLWDILDSTGYIVETVADGAAAMRRIFTGEIDVVLLDQMLPLVHGLDLCRKVRATTFDVHLPIIMLTALSSEEHRRAALAAGADVFLTKPFDIDELLYVIERWVQARDRRKAERKHAVAAGASAPAAVGAVYEAWSSAASQSRRWQ
ncbi:MAG TPA: response regulator [Chloroflexota bacterium]|jgi:DNA-binding response OmpR family regulator